MKYENEILNEDITIIVFYYNGTEKLGKIFLYIYYIIKQNKRKVKPASHVYLMEHITCPGALVECGFLSNHTEAKLLVSSDYQEKMAWAIHMGVLRYLNQSEQ